MYVQGYLEKENKDEDPQQLTSMLFSVNKKTWMFLFATDLNSVFVFSKSVHVRAKRDDNNVNMGHF